MLFFKPDTCLAVLTFHTACKRGLVVWLGSISAPAVSCCDCSTVQVCVQQAAWLSSTSKMLTLPGSEAVAWLCSPVQGLEETGPGRDAEGGSPSQAARPQRFTSDMLEQLNAIEQEVSQVLSETERREAAASQSHGLLQEAQVRRCCSLAVTCLVLLHAFELEGRSGDSGSQSIGWYSHGLL